MTIKELYEWAINNHSENLELMIFNDDNLEKVIDAIVTENDSKKYVELI